MELLLTSTDATDECAFNWDISLTDGIADTVPIQAEKDQEANVVTFLEKNTIPLLEDKGIDWSAFLTKQKSIVEIDAEIRENLKLYTNSMLYTPIYGEENGKLTVKITKVRINTGA